MEQLWANQRRLSVGQVLKRLRRHRKVAYTTVMTLLDKLARKGSATRVKRGKAYLYAPAVERSRVLRFLLEDFSDHYWGGDPRRIVRFLNSRNSDHAKAVPDSSREEAKQTAQAEFEASRVEQPLDVALL